MKYLIPFTLLISLTACHQSFTADNGSKIYQGAGAYLTPSIPDKQPKDEATK